jgi:hypothetical protein
MIMVGTKPPVAPDPPEPSQSVRHRRRRPSLGNLGRFDAVHGIKVTKVHR